MSDTRLPRVLRPFRTGPVPHPRGVADDVAVRRGCLAHRARAPGEADGRRPDRAVGRRHRRRDRHAARGAVRRRARRPGAAEVHPARRRDHQDARRGCGRGARAHRPTGAVAPCGRRVRDRRRGGVLLPRLLRPAAVGAARRRPARRQRVRRCAATGRDAGRWSRDRGARRRPGLARARVRDRRRVAGGRGRGAAGAARDAGAARVRRGEAAPGARPVRRHRWRVRLHVPHAVAARHPAVRVPARAARDRARSRCCCRSRCSTRPAAAPVRSRS